MKLTAELTLHQDLFDHMPMIDVQPLPARHLELARVEAHEVQYRRVEVSDVVALVDGVEADLVGGSVGDSALHAGAREPDREAVRVMIAAVGTLRAGCSAELRPPDY